MIRLDDIVEALLFITTIAMVLYGLLKGFTFTELLMNIFYFSMMVLSLILKVLSWTIPKKR